MLKLFKVWWSQERNVNTIIALQCFWNLWHCVRIQWRSNENQPGLCHAAVSEGDSVVLKGDFGKVRKCIPTSAIWPTMWTIPPGKVHIANLYSATKQHTRMQRQHLRVENKLLNIPNPYLRWFKVECRTAKIFGLDNKFPRVPSPMAMCRISLAVLHSMDTRDFIYIYV